MNLKKFRLEHNLLKQLPTNFSALFQLEKLTLDHNQLTRLPANMENMKKLKVRHIIQIHSDVLKRHLNTNLFKQFQIFQVLRLDSNRLSYIPNDIGRLTSLKELTIHDNPLPDELLDLPDLESVMVRTSVHRINTLCVH